MATWGDYAVTAVSYDDDKTRIEEVERRVVDLDEGVLESPNSKTRQQVIDSINNGYDHTTALEKSNGDWKIGEDIHVIEVSGEEFIRTDQNETDEDNLEDLPEY